MYAQCVDTPRAKKRYLAPKHIRESEEEKDDWKAFLQYSLEWHPPELSLECVAISHRCDDIVHCIDESDEHNCKSQAVFFYVRVHLVSPPILVEFDGRGSVIKTTLSARNISSCMNTHFFCPGGDLCLPVFVICNDVKDCPGHEDEMECDTYTCPGFYRCRGRQGICLHPDHVCDGWPQCPQHDDERFCNLTCPDGCSCFGHSFKCRDVFAFEQFPDLRYLQLSSTHFTNEELKKNIMLVYLSLRHCNLTNFRDIILPNLLNLDLSDNKVTVMSFVDFEKLGNLLNISLSRNPLMHVFALNESNIIPIPNIIHVDLSDVTLRTLDIRQLLPFPNLRSLNISDSRTHRILGDGFRYLTKLTRVDLRGCPVLTFPHNVFSDLAELNHVYADNYKLCCPDTLPVGMDGQNCESPSNEISSCDDLLRSDVYRLGSYILATLALVGNLGCLVLRVRVLRSATKSGFNVFVTHLCVSDFLMGVYLVIIGVADHVYRGVYLWEDGDWRHSVGCKMAGFLSLLSSEMSAFVICLITLDRFLAIRFPFSNAHFSPASAQVTCAVTWSSVLLLALVPLLPATSEWRLYSQTGICAPLPLATSRSPGYQFSFAVIIVLNTLLFLAIAAGQMVIYRAMMTHAMSAQDTSRKSRDLTVARRLLTVVVSDFICWFPVGLLGLLAWQGVPVDGEFNVIVPMLVLPLNSALNPFLYTLNIILEKRTRARDEKIIQTLLRTTAGVTKS